MMNRGILLTVLSLVSVSQAQRSRFRCIGKATDIVFVLDSSSSIWDQDFKRQLVFVDDVVSQFDVGPGTDHTRVGIETFGHKTWLQFNLNEHTYMRSLLSAIKGIVHKGGRRTETGMAIDFMRNNMFQSASGSRQHAGHFGIVITDGRSQEPQKTARAAQEARRQGITLFAIGVGDNISEEELRNIASDPKQDHVFMVDDYRALNTIKDELAARTCPEIATPRPIIRTTTPPDVDPAEAVRSCGGKPADVYFILDSSSSIWEIDFGKQLEFVRNVVKIFDFDSDNTRIGILTYSDSYETRIPLYGNQHKHELLKKIKRIPYTSGLTNTADAIRYVREEGFAHGVTRPDVAHVVILLTDGVSREPDKTTHEARLTHQAGIFVFAIGIGTAIDKDELNRIASDPDYSYVFHVDSFGLLDSIKNTLALKACKVTPKPQKVCFGDSSADVMFVFDSAYLGTHNTKLVVAFANEVVRSLDYNTKNTRIGIMAENCQRGLDLTFSSPSVLSSHMSRISYPSFRSLIERLRSETFTNKDGYALPVAIIFIDGSMDSRDLKEAAEEVMRLKYQGVEVYAVVVGNPLSSALKMSLASHPVDHHYFTSPSYEMLFSIKDRLLDILCDVMSFNVIRPQWPHGNNAL
ncbi:hypothetical protein ScPMuIL_017505 [Solemya velum]